MANLQIKLDDTLRDEAQSVASQLGLDLPTAVRMFLVQMVRHNGLPFQPTITPTPSHKPVGQKSLKKEIWGMED